ncbi:hypothetical protein PRIPAC_73275 [Pristionchus pacificus]|uniref:Uncharacterized protein n=1 Tax=Pristionchus pacificus TaxID=54126 RepID=A0A2A6CRS8_PRIPA|nr:hypothetical protein PRIPAC_73275 [Pristionchus pacificus]|eukprot:PDM80796.1 hypothetical protein PRIPAC_35799 [Pristionchus pacificus]
MHIFRKMNILGLSILVLISLYGIESLGFDPEEFKSLIRQEANHLDITPEQLITSCEATYIPLVPVDDRAMIQQDLQKFKKELTSDVRRKRSANNEKRIQQRLQAYQDYLRTAFDKYHRLLNESAYKLSDESIKFWNMASKEVSDNFEYIGKASLRQEITDAEYIKGFENMFLAWNKIISGYNKLSSKSKKELEKTFCIRVIVKGIMTKPLSVVQPILDKIAIEKAKAGMARDTIKLVTIEAYE